MATSDSGPSGLKGGTLESLFNLPMGMSWDQWLQKQPEALRDGLCRLIEALDQLEELLALGDAAYWRYDVPSRMFFCSPQAWELVGRIPSPPSCSYDVWAALLHEDDRQTVERAARALLKGETSRVEVYYRVHNPEGVFRWMFSSGEVTRRDANGRVLRMAGLLRDANSDMQVRQALRECEHLVRQAEIRPAGPMPSRH